MCLLLLATYCTAQTCLYFNGLNNLKRYSCSDYMVKMPLDKRFTKVNFSPQGASNEYPQHIFLRKTIHLATF